MAVLFIFVVVSRMSPYAQIYLDFGIPLFFVVADQFGKKYCFSVILICRLIDHTTTTS
jgi:hypothetical protein